jgi:3-methyladenine DNA glycosylase/8-oxoguanine DNA glycosylase
VSGLVRTVPCAGIDLLATLSPLTALAGDPTVRLAPGRFARATWTPDGPGAVVATWEDGGSQARVEAHGAGAAWLVERAGRLLGAEDDVSGFDPDAAPLRALWRRHGGDRIARTGTVWHDLAWFVVQQRIRRTDAAAQWRRLVTALGAPVDGVADLLAPPGPAALARLSYDDLHRFGLERRRAEHLLHGARAARALHRFVDGDAERARPALRAVPGIGPWTASCLLTHTWGDRDGVIVGDDGVPSMVAWLLAGERRADDARMLALLDPFRPHRYRVVRLAFLAGARPPRLRAHAPRNDIRRR